MIFSENRYPLFGIMLYIFRMNERPALRPSVAVGEALRGVARDILAEARAAIEEPAKSDAEAVHDFRRAMKRWRALLRLVEPFLGAEAKRLRDEARDLARALAGARNAQSALDALGDLDGHGLALSKRSVAGLRRRIDDIRRSAETTLNGDMRLRLASALDQASAVVERWPLHTLTFDDVADQLARFYRDARRLLPADWPTADAEDLHELRKWVVIHRYQIDIIEPLWPRFVKMWSSEAQRLRDRLGRHQDLVMLESLMGLGNRSRAGARASRARSPSEGPRMSRPPRASPRAFSSRSRTHCAGASPRCGRPAVDAMVCACPYRKTGSHFSGTCATRWPSAAG
jgi:CHAD domain-containing protein